LSISTAQTSIRSASNRGKNNCVQSVFEARDLCWQVGQLKILKKLNFSISENSFVGIIGPNGAGKSSLLRCLYGLNKLSSGELIFKEKKSTAYSRRELAQQIAVVVQEPPTHFDMSVTDVVAMGLIPHKSLLSFSTREELAIIADAIDKVELSEKKHAAFNTLSGGEKQRVMIARAIVQNPQVLILDEPTNHLDVQHQIEVLQLVKKMSITVLLSIHDLNLAAAFCDRLILLDKGKIVADGSCEQVLTPKILKDIFNIQAQVDQHPFHFGRRISINFASEIDVKSVTDMDDTNEY